MIKEGSLRNAHFKYFANLSGIQNLQATSYYPETNGVTEQMNQTVVAILRTLLEKCKNIMEKPCQ